MKRISMLALSLALAVPAVYAHNGLEHVMGTVTTVTPTSVEVKTMDGSKKIVAFTADTKYLKGATAIKQEEIKVGDHVVIHAAKKGDQLMATEVRVGATKGTQGAMGGMKMDGDSKPKPQ